MCAISGCGSSSGGGGSNHVTPPSNLAYPQAAITAVVGTSIQTDTPTVTGTVSSYSIAPSLPAGLAISASSGAISGTPTAVSAQTSYTVTASNSGGATTAIVQITVNPAAPASLVYPQTVINATTGVAIQADTPAVTGSVSSFSISPALPAGLSFDTATGTISGTPTTASVQTSYTVTASNAGGSTTATLSITVSQAPPGNLVYPTATINATVGNAIQADTPSFTGSVSSFSIVPELPKGLSLDPTSGAISGIPSLPSAQQVYTVTAMNAGGSTSAQITITVAAPGTQLVDHGHQSAISHIAVTGDHVLTSDNNRWILWDYASGNVVADGERSAGVDLAGEIFVIQTTNYLQVRSAQNGQLLAQLPLGTWFSLARDGSYICTGNSSGLTVWSTAGQSELALNGDYSNAIVFAAPNQLQIANGAAGSSVIETVTLPSGADSVSPPFSGSFSSWFSDGSSFLTSLGNVVWEYSSAGVQEGILTVPSSSSGSPEFGGNGNWVWAVGWDQQSSTDSLEIFPVGSSTATQTYTLPQLSTYVSSGPALGALVYGSPQMSVIDLSGASPSISAFTLPSTTAYLSSFAATSGSQWVVGNQHGVLLDGASLSSTPRYFGYGAVFSIAAADNVAAVSTAIGRVLLYDISTSQQTGSIDFQAGKVVLSSDGAVLGAAAESLDAQYSTDRTLNFYSLPSAAVIQSYPYAFNTAGTPFLTDFSLSGSGATVGQSLMATQGVVSYSRQVTGISGAPLIWNDTGASGPVYLSPDGTHVAVSTTNDDLSQVITTVYHNGLLVTALPGVAEGWPSDNQLLVANYTNINGMGARYASTTTYDATGTATGTLTIGPFGNAQFPAADSVYTPQTNALYSLTANDLIWAGPTPVGGGSGVGAVAGSIAIYEFDGRIVETPIN